MGQDRPSSTDESDPVSNQQSTYVGNVGLTVLHEPDHPVADIVFIHGLQGGPRTTWTCKVDTADDDSSQANAQGAVSSFFAGKRNPIRYLSMRKHKPDRRSTSKAKPNKKEVFWPLDHLPDDCANARILTWGYNSRVTEFFGGPSDKSKVSDYARNLLFELSRIRENEERPLLFVAHSLGGIILKHALWRANDRDDTAGIYHATRMVMFLGTPHRGSDKVSAGKTLLKIASASGFSTNRKQLQTLTLHGSELESLHHAFMKLQPWPFNVYTFQEGRGMSGYGQFKMGEKVVEDFSSALLETQEHCETIDANHVSMCRFASKQDPGYRKVVGILRQCVCKAEREVTNKFNIRRAAIDRSLDAEAEPTTLSETSSSTYSFNELDRHFLALVNTLDIANHRAFLDRAVEGTCTWILDTPQYRRWLSHVHTCLLWISGHPGTGKTTLSAYLSEVMGAGEPGTGLGSTVCFFFCDEKIETQRDGNAILRSLIFQLLLYRPKLIRHIKETFTLRGTQLKHDFFALWRIFLALASDERVGSVRIIIDAIDECEEVTRQRLLERIADLMGDASSVATKHSSCLQFLITSRPSLGRQAIYDSYLFQDVPTERLRIEDFPQQIEDDLRLVIRARIRALTDSKPRAMQYIPYLEHTLLTKANQTFLWVSVVLCQLKQSPLQSPPDYKRILNGLPRGLSATYQTFLERISPDNHELARLLLHFIIGSYRALTLDEIGILLALSQHHPSSLKTLEAVRQFDMQETIELMLGPLIRIWGGQVYLVHQSVKEYLEDLATHESSDPLSRRYGVRLEEAHSQLAEACTMYLLLDEVDADMSPVSHSSTPTSHVIPTSPNDLDQPGDFQDPFNLEGDYLFQDAADVEADVCVRLATRLQLLDYAAVHWARHFAFSNADGSSDRTILALALYRSHGRSPRNWYRYYRSRREPDVTSPSGCDGFINACFFGHLVLVRLLCETESGPDVDQMAEGVYWAAREGYEGVVDYLLVAGAVVNHVDPEGHAALAIAAQLNHVAVVDRLLMERGAEVNHQGAYGRTPLLIASLCGHVPIVRTLLNDRRVRPNVADVRQWTPAIWSSYNGYVDVLKLLAAHNQIDLAHVDRDGRDALAWAAARGENGVVRYLLKVKDLNISRADFAGRTAYSLAAEHGHLSTVSLLKSDPRTDVTRTDHAGRNAISWACQGGHHPTVQQLIRHAPQIVDRADENQWTPLLWALSAQSGLQTVTCLLNSGLVDVNHLGRGGRTALSYAAGYGYDEVVRVILATPGVDVNSLDDDHKTPLTWAASSGACHVVRTLLTTTGVERNPRDERGQTPLSWAARNGWVEVVQEFQGVEGIEFDTRDDDGRTPLSLAAAYGHIDVVQCLIEKGDVQVDSMDHNGQTPEWWAASNGHTYLVRILSSSEKSKTAKIAQQTASVASASSKSITT
ncbi:MAG: hypothetical protein M1825_004402 [Sarcosagium campestre]|nr:MAG: hypothetical protein M1825_004402 [Sarcosagium campestre]